jgi:hypothetical protein
MILTLPEDIARYQMLVIARALRYYHDTGRKVNSAYTPRAMMQTAEHLTGQKFKPRDYLQAAQALKDKAGECNEQ